MAFTFWGLLEAALLLVNAICVLHEERFLAKVGWGGEQMQAYGSGPSVKSQILNIIRSVRTVMRIPLIFINVGVILVKFVLG
ncbi:immediate early response 3-interacting protein 1-like [Daphnia pulex]|uniref:immediate early response 3-interacting protein 1-like n=1 Tax=Daphnia pulex TaxID=6669 RepID=UPI001EDFEA47|nr:immediate early response 3-interacting protein 1-like [Daphnia pulex]XP_046643359.1 immediate early response 3-interacting protein 1-like [Daphnia pulicaria]